MASHGIKSELLVRFKFDGMTWDSVDKLIDKITEIARGLGKGMRTLKDATNDIKQEITKSTRERLPFIWKKALSIMK